MKRIAPEHGVTAYAHNRCRCAQCRAIWAAYCRVGAKKARREQRACNAKQKAV